VTFVSIDALTRDRSHSLDLHGYVVGSRYMAEHVAAHGFVRDRIHVLPLSVGEPRRAASERAPADGTVLFVGGLVRGKGLDVLFDAVAATPAVRALWVAGTGRQEPELRRRAARLGLGARVQWLGRLDAEALEDAYARAAVVVVPSRAPETFGLAGLEASARGIPVIASDVGGLREWLEPEANGVLVPSNDASALASALDRVLRDRPLAERLGAEGRVRYERRHRPEQHDAALVALLSKCLARRAA
jgi:glycosyltransferase involved in cell wall biosynthesis